MSGPGVEDLAPSMVLAVAPRRRAELRPSLAARGDRIIVGGIGQGWLVDPSLCHEMQYQALTEEER